MPHSAVTKRLAVGVLLINLFVVTLAGLSLRQSWVQSQERATVATQNLAMVLDEEIGGDIDKIDVVLLSVTDEIERQIAAGGVDKRALNAFLLRQQLRLPEVISLRVTDSHGMIAYGAEIGPDFSNVAFREYFIRQRDNANAGLVIAKPVMSHIEKKWVIPLSRRVNYPGGGFFGVVYVNVSIDHLIKTFSTLDMGSHGAANLKDDSLNIMARYPEPQGVGGAIGQNTPSPQLQALVRAGKDAGTYKDQSVLDKIERICSYRKISDYPLYVTVGLAADDYMVGWWAEAKKMAALAATFFLITLVSAWLIYRGWKRQALAHDSLHHSEIRFANMLENAPIGMAVVSLDGRFEKANRALCEIVGYEAHELRKRTFQEITYPDDLETDLANVKKLLAGEISSFQMEKRYVRKDGQIVWVQLTGSLMRDSSGKPLHFIAQVENISHRKQVEEQLKLAAKVFESSGECIVITDADEHILTVNKAFSTITGYSPEEVIGQTPRLMSSGQHDADFYRKMWQSLQSRGYWQGEIWDQRKNGDLYPKWVSISVVKDSSGQPSNYIGVFSDITESKAAEAQIEFLAYHDALTELPNRRLAVDHLELALAYADRSETKAAVLFLDLDNFKTINDSFGHATGDALLKAVAKRLRECTRETDTISRQGGDEFLVVLANVSDADAITGVAEKILEKIEQSFHIEGNELSTSLSIGIAVYPDDSKDIDTLLNLADTAMYHAKEAGRNAYRFYTEQMNEDAHEHQRIRVGLRRALERDEFVLYYQPQIDLASGAVIGAEALIRWNHPEQGFLPPGRFIPIAEESGLIVPMGDWVLREACRQAAAWQKAGLPELVVAVNISAMQFKRGDLEQSVLQALSEAGLAPKFLELELTESILIHDTENVLEAVQRLKSHGILLSIDDFGTGYSSLSYLKRFDVDKLKIDRSFVCDMVDNPNDAVIVRAIIQMARSLNLKTIAEGVEDEHLLAFLRLQYCDEAQGYYFARPMPADEFARYLSNAQITSA